MYFYYHVFLSGLMTLDKVLYMFIAFTSSYLLLSSVIHQINAPVFCELLPVEQRASDKLLVTVFRYMTFLMEYLGKIPFDRFS